MYHGRMAKKSKKKSGQTKKVAPAPRAVKRSRVTKSKSKPAVLARKPRSAVKSSRPRAAAPRKGARDFSVTHQVDQRMSIDLSTVDPADAASATESHREPDIYVEAESFPGKMTWRITRSLVQPSPGKPKRLLLERTILFTFSWADQRAMSRWAEENVECDNSLLPSHVAGDFQGLFVGDEMMDYETEYRGPCV
jgi:hypothetical protein